MSDDPTRRPFQYKVAVAAAWMALAWEQAWPRLWPPVAAVLVFIVLALFDLPAVMPWWAHWAFLACFGAAIVALTVRGLRRFSWPRHHLAARRVELASGWSHRPLTSMDDPQIAGTADVGSRRMWKLHKGDLSRRRPGMRSGWPHPSRHMPDRLGLRPILVLVLVVAFVVSGDKWSDRLSFAVSPDMSATAASVPIALDLFVTPPDYTRLPPIYRTGAAGEADMSVPHGSVVTARISGARTAPELSLAGQALPFEPLGAEAFEIEIIPAEGGTLSIESGNDVLGTWQIDLTPDDAPTLSFVDPPSETARWAVRVAWQAVDEYGVTAVRLHLALADDAPVALDRIDETIILSQPLRPVTEADGVAFEDLTPHPWAGLPVTAWLEADDGAGQSGRSELVDLILPEREFVHPVAQAIVDQRRRLLHDPGDYEFVAEVLQDLSIRPNRFGQDIVVFMALRTAARRLQWAGDPISAVEPVAALLWETALRLEDGDLSLAFDRLRRVQDALQEALDSGASDAEIARLMDELRQAMDDYLAALQQDFQERMAAGDLGELQPVNPEQMIDQSQLDAMMDRIEELGQMGAHDEASELLEQLQQMMENLQPGAQMAQPGQQSEGLEMLEDLQALTQAQQALLDRTFQQATQTPRGDPQNRQFSDEAGQVQDALRRQLGDTMRRLGEMTGDIPGELGRAELSMRDAERALEQGEPRRATGPQTEALDQLQQGLQSFAEQLMEQMAQQGQGVQPGQILPQRRAGDDPLGRRVEGDGGTSGEGTELPPDTAVERARTILDELRRRAGERARPQDELDYIDRLLRRF